MIILRPVLNLDEKRNILSDIMWILNVKVFRTQFADVQKTNSIFSALKNVKQKDH